MRTLISFVVFKTYQYFFVIKTTFLLYKKIIEIELRTFFQLHNTSSKLFTIFSIKTNQKVKKRKNSITNCPFAWEKSYVVIARQRCTAN